MHASLDTQRLIGDFVRVLILGAGIFLAPPVSAAISVAYDGQTGEGPQSPQSLYDLGLSELRSGHPASAAALLKKADGLAPHTSAILLALVQALVRSGLISEANRYADEISRQKPPDSRVQMEMGLTYLGARQCQAAQTWFEAGVKTDPTLRDRLFPLAEQAFNGRHYNEALCLAESARKFSPRSAPIHSLAGACYYYLHKPPQAVQAIQEALQLDPDNEGYYIQLAQVFIGNNTPEAAVILLEPARNRFPKSGMICFVLGVARMMANKPKDAEQDLKQSLLLVPSYPPALRALAALYEYQDQWKFLSSVGESLASLPVSRAEGFYYQAEAAYYLYKDQPADYSRIDQLLQTSLVLRPNFAPAHLLKGKLSMEREQYRDAVASLQRSLALDSSQSSAYYSLALAYNKLGEHEKSAEAMNQFRRLSAQKKTPKKKLNFQVVPAPAQQPN